jgi:hypothetical protein
MRPSIMGLLRYDSLYVGSIRKLVEEKDSTSKVTMAAAAGDGVIVPFDGALKEHSSCFSEKKE